MATGLLGGRHGLGGDDVEAVGGRCALSPFTDRLRASRRLPRLFARELVATARRSVTIDWTIRDNVRAQLRVIVKRILRKYGYPPDKQERATRTVLEQAEVLSEAWAIT
jgi:hypothetical protein